LAPGFFAKSKNCFQEHDRARAIYRLALDKLPKDKCAELYKNYTAHEKKFGERVGIENVILKKRKLQYEEEIAASPMNYDAWFDYLKLIESEAPTLLQPT
jgi:crooked neck